MSLSGVLRIMLDLVNGRGPKLSLHSQDSGRDRGRPESLWKIISFCATQLLVLVLSVLALSVLSLSVLALSVLVLSVLSLSVLSLSVVQCRPKCPLPPRYSNLRVPVNLQSLFLPFFYISFHVIFIIANFHEKCYDKCHQNRVMVCREKKFYKQIKSTP